MKQKKNRRNKKSNFVIAEKFELPSKRKVPLKSVI